MALNIDAKLDEKLICAFKNNARHFLANFHILKNTNLILEK